MKAKTLPLLLGMALTAGAANAVEDASLQQLRDQLNSLQQQLDRLEQEAGASTAAVDESAVTEDGVRIGGAVRFGYRYQDSNRHYGGDMRYDTFRLDVSGSYKGISILSKWRWFQNHKALIQVAEMGYDFTEQHNLKAGLTLVPFGNQEYNSHNFDLSPNFYLGLEDTYQFGMTYTYQGQSLNIQASFFKNDSSVGGMGEDSYSPTLNTIDYDDVNAERNIGAYNTGALRIANTFTPHADWQVEVGVSGLYGGVLDLDPEQGSNMGELHAYALHSSIDYKNWHVQLQATHYEYHLDRPVNHLGMAFYGGVYANVATRASTYTSNVKYHIPMALGPIEGVDIYNDYTVVKDKPNNAPHGYHNVLGVGIAAGPVYTFLDWTISRHQDDMVNGSGSMHMFNANFGYYF